MIKSKKITELVFAILVFALFIGIACYKLTNASLWFDETIEYWFSKVLFGALPYEEAFSNTANMYERIITTLQPPLYNILLYVWLKISDAEWWFRFFGVVMGIIGMLGIYKSVKALCNAYAASLSVLFSTMVYRLLYYWLECAEYCLMLGMLCLAMYFFIQLIIKPTSKNIIFFTLFACMAVYSQYGAAFPVVCMASIAVIYIICQKNKKLILTITASYASALVFAAVPLYIFFLKAQMSIQADRTVKAETITFTNGFLSDFFHSIQTVLKWNFLPGCSDTIVCAVLTILLLLIVMSLIFGKIKPVKYIILLNTFMWLAYYFAVKFRFYAYGSFGDRYSLFFIPFWIVLIFSVCFDIFSSMQDTIHLFHLKIQKANYVLLVPLLISMIVFCIFNWNTKIQPDWFKQDIRAAAAAWYEHDAYQKDTLVYYSSNSGFSYYIRQNDHYNAQTEANVQYMPWIYNEEMEAYINYLNDIYGTAWPDELYFVASHTQNDVQTIIESFTSNGYEATEIFNQHDGMLFYLSK